MNHKLFSGKKIKFKNTNSMEQEVRPQKAFVYVSYMSKLLRYFKLQC